MAAVLALWTFRHELGGRRALLMIDSESVVGGLVKGNSDREDLGPLVAEFWSLCREFSVALYIDRIPTDANLADKQSRALRSFGVGRAGR